MKDTVCIYSGGMDSYTMVALAHRQGRLHSCLGFLYGQRHRKELDYAQRACDKLFQVPYRVLDLGSAVWLGASALAPDAVLPTDHYEDPSQRATCVPNRNMVMLASAISYTVAHGLNTVQYGAHAGDRAVYPDCRCEFIELMDMAARLANWHPVRIEAPFLDRTKVGILQLGLEYQLDYAEAWTCYEGGTLACGRCGSCQERLAAFNALGVVDPMPYGAV